MSYNEGMLNTISAVAGADLSGKLFFGVSLVNDTNNPPGVHAIVGTAAKGITGVLQNNPLPGQAAEIQTTGTTKVAITAGVAVIGGTTFLDLDVGGTFTTHAAGTVVAQALESCTAGTAIQIVSARLTNTLTA